jgi:uncharacterized membrane protein
LRLAGPTGKIAPGCEQPLSDEQGGEVARTGAWILITVLALFVAAYAFMGIALPGVRSPVLGEIFASRTFRGIGHLGAGGVAITVGALQFSLKIRFGHPRVHRTLGKVYVIAVLISGTAGGLLAPWSDGGVPAHYGFGMLAVLWVSTAVIAWSSARAGDFVTHRAWMIRSYALCLAAVTLRLYLPMSGAVGLPFEAAYPAIAWLCWVPNLVIAEWLVIPSRVAPLDPPEVAGMHAA